MRRLPDGFPRLGATWALKSVAAVGVLGGAVVALALPVDASPTALALAVPAASASAARTDDLAASRSAARARLASAPAVSAPVDAAPLAPEAVGVAGVKAVAKPKPKPKPKPAAKATTASGCRRADRPLQHGHLRPLQQPRPDPQRRAGLHAPSTRCSTSARSAAIAPTPASTAPGQAVDLMISGQSQGDAVAAFVQAHAAELNVKYVIWRQRYWEPGGSWEPMEDRGSPTANHMDHVHVTANY